MHCYCYCCCCCDWFHDVTIHHAWKKSAVVRVVHGAHEHEHGSLVDGGSNRDIPRPVQRSPDPHPGQFRIECPPWFQPPQPHPCDVRFDAPLSEKMTTTMNPPPHDDDDGDSCDDLWNHACNDVCGDADGDSIDFGDALAACVWFVVAARYWVHSYYLDHYYWAVCQDGYSRMDGCERGSLSAIRGRSHRHVRRSVASFVPPVRPPSDCEDCSIENSTSFAVDDPDDDDDDDWIRGPSIVLGHHDDDEERRVAVVADRIMDLLLLLRGENVVPVAAPRRRMDHTEEAVVGVAVVDDDDSHGLSRAHRPRPHNRQEEELPRLAIDDFVFVDDDCFSVVLLHRVPLSLSLLCPVYEPLAYCMFRNNL
eukprot:scaffold58059_cov45-Attheya_sp.AAC.5